MWWKLTPAPVSTANGFERRVHSRVTVGFFGSLFFFMKIIQQTADVLVLEQRPKLVTVVVLYAAAAAVPVFVGWQIAAVWAEKPWFLKLFVLAMSMAPLLLIIRQLTVNTCTVNAKQRTLTLKRKNLLKLQILRHTFREIQDVRLETLGENDDRFEIRVQLHHGSYLALNEWLAADNQRSAEEATSRINLFLNKAVSQGVRKAD